MSNEKYLEKILKEYIDNKIDIEFQKFQRELNEYHNLLMAQEYVLKSCNEALIMTKQSFDIIISDLNKLKKVVKID